MQSRRQAHAALGWDALQRSGRALGRQVGNRRL